MKLYGTIVGLRGRTQLSFDGDLIADVSPAPPDAPASDLLIAPPFTDIQVNGYGGCSFLGAGASPGALVYVVRAFRQAGVLFFCPTVVTDSGANISHALRALSAARQDSEVAHATPCFHLEGPYVSPEDGPRGAHPAEHVRPPDWDEFRRFQDAAEGRIGIVTLAPEQPGSLPFIERLAGAGVVVSLGHTGANARQIADAVKAGARLSTHLGNGSHAKVNRHNNYIWEQLANDALTASIIADGYHLPPSVVKCFIRAKGVEQTILTSDVVAAGGLSSGTYRTPDGREIEVRPGGRVNLKGTPYLAGAGLLLPAGIENAVRFAGISLAESVRMATTIPARLLGMEDRVGAVAPGKEATLTLFRWNAETYQLAVEGVVLRGRLIRAAEMGDALKPAGTQLF
ncbi:MAG: amidohydrolase family protein [Armatimonadetes bacterium]|nr:amidohydrolase family protein [Armatimonadota bacterium]